MKTFTAYEMEYTGDRLPRVDIPMIPFSDKYYTEYERVYNECFREMRTALDITPYDFYSDIRQLDGRKKKIFLLPADNGTLIGSVGCFGTEIDDLIVNRMYQGRGYGKRLLIWAINRIRDDTGAPITLHVADRNRKAIGLYLNTGFVIKSSEVINREQ